MNHVKLLVLLSFVFTKSFSQTLCFKTIDDYSYAQNYNGGFVNSLNQSVTGDFNNDGFKDVVLGGYGSFLLFYSGTSTGTFAPSALLTNVNFTIGSTSFLSDDYNNDGKLDVAVVGNLNAAQDTKMQILYGNGNGTFSYGLTYVSPPSLPYNYLMSFDQGDLNNDGYTDFLLTFNANVNQSTVWTVMNSSTGNLTFNNPLPTFSLSVADLFDYNNDNNLDIFFNGSVLQGNGNGTFNSTPIGLNNNSINYISVTDIADLNGDGFKDILYHGQTINDIYYRYNNGAGGFSAEYSIATEYPVSFMKMADLNGDGLKDVVAYVDSMQVLQVFKNNGFNVFTPVAKIQVVAPYNSQYILFNYSILDLNNDSKMDIVVPGGINSKFNAILGNANFSYTSNDVISFHGANFKMGVTANDFNNDGVGDFTSATSYMSVGIGLASGGFTATGSGPFSANSGKVYSMDFNNDGFKDVVAVNNGSGPSNTFSFYSGTGTGNFSNSYYVTNNPSWITTASDLAFADFDNDTYIDVVTANVSLFGYSILKGNTSFSFPTYTFATLTSASNDVVTGDFNNDGFADFITVNSGAKINVLLGNGNCTFQAPLTMTLSTACSLIETGNYNGDNFKDLVLISTSSSGINLLVLFGTGTGSFTVNQSTALSTTFNNIKSADLNNDGIDEIILSKNGMMQNVWVGVVNSVNNFIFSKFTVETNPGQIDVYDMNNDGAKDIIVADNFGASNTGCIRILYNTSAIFNNPSSTYSICTGGSVLVSIPNNYNIQWSNGGNANPKLFNTPGNYTVTTSNLSGSCASSSTFQVVTSTNAITPLSITNTLTSFCNNASSITLSSNPPALSFYGNGVNQNLFSPQQATVGINKIYATYTNTNQCTSIDSISFNINPSPIVNAGNDTLLCYAAVINLNATGNAITYAWNNSVSNNAPFVPNNIPLNGIKYVVTGTNNFGCISKDSLTVNLDNTCNIVWPGDTDVDGVVNTNDFLVLGLAYGYSGPPRIVTGNSWLPHQSDYWNSLIPSTNYKLCHSDCNGSGIINLSDTLAINLNFSQIHVVKPLPEPQNSNLNADLYFQFNKPVYNSGDTIVADLFLGASSTVITGLYGTSFYLEYDNSTFKSGGINVSYDYNSWIGLNNLSKINFSKINESIGRIDFAMVKTTHHDTSGYGKFLTLQMILKDTLQFGHTMLELKNGIKMNATGIKTPIVTAMDSVFLNPLDVGLTENLLKNNIFLAPNPTNSEITIISNNEVSEVEITNLVGQIVYKRKVNERQVKVDLRNYTDGIYIVKTTTNNKKTNFNKIILDKR